jgi:hypothetical protein
VDPVDLATAAGAFVTKPPFPSVGGREGVGTMAGRRVYVNGRPGLGRAGAGAIGAARQGMQLGRGWAELTSHAKAGRIAVPVERAPLADVARVWQ